MESTEQSCQKQISDGKKRKMASDSSDRLSALPDCVLAHILSFLSTKLSVSTSILGKRWRFLWSQVPILDFDSDDYDYSGTALSKIINKVMMLHKVTNLDTFRLYHHYGDLCCDFEFEAWIATLSDRNVRNLNLNVYLVNEKKVPLCLFNCETLVDLTLIGRLMCMDIPRTGPLCLPALKKLHLSGVTFANVPLWLFNCKTLVDLTLTGWCVCMDIPRTGPMCLPALKKLHLSRVTFALDSTYESLPHLLSGCPVLEELLVEVNSPENTVVICHVASPTLNNLVLISEGRAVFEVKIDTPALRYLKLGGYMSDVSAGALPSLVEADISFWNCELFKSNIFYCPVIEFLGKLCNVKWLKLRIGQLKVYSPALAIKFYNLTQLELADDARFIKTFLKNADNLQVLTILRVNGHLYWTDPKQVPACLASHLRKVKIHSVECKDQELRMMRYILRNAKVLKMMKICSSDGIDKLQTLKRISTFQRGSETCQVVFS